MFRSILKYYSELDRRIKVLSAFIGVHLMHQELTTQYGQLFATGLGADPIELGTLNSISNIASSVIAFPSGWIADKYGPKKVLLLGLASIVFISITYSLAYNWWMLIPGIILLGVSQRLIMPFVDMLFINIGGAKNKSLIFSISRTLWAIPRSFSPIIAAFIIANLGGLSVGAEAIRPLYYLQFFLSILILFSIAVLVKIPQEDTAKKNMESMKERSFLQDFQDLFRGEKYLTRYIFLSTVRTIGMNTALAFLPLWIVNVKGADQYIIGSMTTVGMITAMILQVPVGRLSDKIGRKKTFFLLCPFSYAARLLLIFAPSPDYLILAGFIGDNGSIGGSGIGGTSFIPNITMNWEMVSAEKRGRWLGIQSFFGIFTFPASILGGILWQQGYMIEVLLLPIILEILVTIPIMVTIPETLGRTSSL